jgi:hypothetical protein
MINLYEKLSEDKDYVLAAAGQNDDWRVYERGAPAPFWWAVVRLLGERGQAIYGVKGCYSLSEARFWVCSDAARREAVSMAVEASGRHGLLLDDIRNDVADAGFLSDDENSWYVEPRHQVKKLIEAHRGLRTMCRDLQATNQGLLTDIEELQQSLRNKDIAHGEKLSAYAEKLGAYAKEIEKQKDKADILLIALLSIIALNIASLLR